MRVYGAWIDTEYTFIVNPYSLILQKQQSILQILKLINETVILLNISPAGQIYEF